MSNTEITQPSQALAIADEGMRDEPHLSLIAKMAKDPAVSADKMKALIDLHNSECERQRREEAFKDLASLKFDLPQIKKTKSAEGRYSYSPMHDLMRQIGSNMRDNNITATYTHGGDRASGNWTECILLHRNGFQFSPVRTHVAPPRENKMLGGSQVMGVMNSYGERYALKAALGLVFTDEDTDGVEAPEEPLISIDDLISMKMRRASITDEQINDFFFEKGVDYPEKEGWRGAGEKFKQGLHDKFEQYFTQEVAK